MDNGSVVKREMKAATSNVNKRTSPLWPLVVFCQLLILTLWIAVTGLTRNIKALLKQKKSVKGKVVLITGAGRGLGRNVALSLAKLGARVACVDINSSNNEETARLIKEDGGTAQAFACNVAKAEDVERLKREVKAKMGSVEILVNNAALLMAMSVKDHTYKDIRAIFEVNLMGPVFMVKAFLDDMLDAKCGHIVTISSVGAVSSPSFLSLYCSSKSGLSRFFECVRVELETMKDVDIPVTTVHPFFINTSADYTSWFETHLPILEENYVSRCVVDAILFEKTSVTVPSALGFTKVTDAMVGSYQYNCLMNLLGEQIRLPTKTERESLPYSTIVADTTK